MRLSNVLLLIAVLALPLAASAATLNELRVDQAGTDYDEYVELAGTPGESLNGLTIVIIGDGATLSGTIEGVNSLDGYEIQADGFFVIAETGAPGCTGTVYDAFDSINAENSDNVTYMLVSGFTGAVAEDIDADDDGVIDYAPWDYIVDSIALVETFDVPASGEYFYGDNTVGPDGTYVPGHAMVCGETWFVASFDSCVDETPGAMNDCTVDVDDNNTLDSFKAMFR